ncbi:hypothetical protein [Ralstonia pickettii]
MDALSPRLLGQVRIEEINIGETKPQHVNEVTDVGGEAFRRGD